MSIAEHPAYLKAKRVSDAAKLAGWEVKATKEHDELHLNMTKDAPEGRLGIHIGWQPGGQIHWTPPPSASLNENYTRQLNNASAVIKALKGEVDILPSERKPRIKKMTDPLLGDGPVRMVRKVPFNDDDPDEEILALVLGRKIIVKNSISESIETIRVDKMKNVGSRNFYLDDAPNGKSILSFHEDTGAYRAVYLENILRVG